MEKQKLFHITENELSERAYNAAIGLSILVTLIVTFAAAYLFKDSLGTMFIAHPLIFSILYLAVSLLAGYIVGLGISIWASMIGLCLLAVATGALLSSVVPYAPLGILVNAGIATLSIVAIMIAISTIAPSLFDGLGKILLVSLSVSIIVELALLIFHISEPALLDWIVVVIFTLYVGYDWSKALNYPRRGNYAVLAACDLYLDIINLFIRFLSILGRSKND